MAETPIQKKKISICMVVTNDLRMDNRVKREALALSRAGFDVSVVCIRSAETPAEEMMENVRITRVQPAAWRGIHRELPWRTLWYYRHVFSVGTETMHQMYQVLVARQADIYHAHDLDTLLLARQAARRVGAKLVYDAHELYTETLTQLRGRGLIQDSYVWFARRYYAWIERRLIREAACVITVNPMIAEVLRQRYNVRLPATILNCPDFVDAGQLAIRDFRNIFGLPRDAKILLYQGVLGPGRGLHQIVQAAKFLPADYHIVFMGYGDFRAALEQEAKQLVVSNRVHFQAAVPSSELLRYTASADLGWLTIEAVNESKRLASPNKLFEYMMAGVPAIANRLPFLEKIVTEERIGILVDSLEPPDLARAAVAMLRSPEYSAMRQNALRAAKTTYHWQREAHKLVRLYQALFQ